VPHRAGEASGYTRPCGLGKGASRQLGQTIVLSRAIRKATHPSLSPASLDLLLLIYPTAQGW